MKENIVIIGAGASGLFAAIKASEKNYDITVLEANEKAGKKILMTGNGRCNLTNMIMSSKFYYTKDLNFVENVINKFNQKDTIREFNKFGVAIKDKNNYIYPNSMQASTVLSALLSICNLRGIKIETDNFVNEIKQCEDGSFIINARDTKANSDLQYKASKLLIACGTKACVKEDYLSGINDFIKATSHRMYRQLPALCSIYAKKDKTLKPFFKNTSGVRSEINCSLYFDNNYITESGGELQITDYGFSGIVIFQISRFISRVNNDFPNANKVLYIDFLPSYDTARLLEIFKSELYYEKKSLQDLFDGIINSKLSHELLMLYSAKVDGNIKPFNKNIPLEKLQEIIEFLKNTPFIIDKTNSANFSQVCTGGVCTNDIYENMESKLVKNLYFSGECIDVDGMCGGYNLQWAWSTGYIAGRSMTND